MDQLNKNKVIQGNLNHIETQAETAAGTETAIQKSIKLEEWFHLKLNYFAKKNKKLEAEVKHLKAENESRKIKIIALGKEKSFHLAENLNNSHGNFKQVISNQSSQQDNETESVSFFES